jgi:hypothetical protein
MEPRGEDSIADVDELVGQLLHELGFVFAAPSTPPASG